MLTDIKFPEYLCYSSDDERKPIEFYIECLKNSNKLDLKLGYFSSNAIRVLSMGFAKFIHNDGKVRIITNHYLSDKDKRLLEVDKEQSEFDYRFIKSKVENDILGLEKILSFGEQHFFNCLKYLLLNGKLVIKPVKLKPNRLTHYKEGVFSDGENDIYFHGSCNFTYSGLIENGESLEIKRSWGEAPERKRIEREKNKIDKILTERDPEYEYLNAEQVIEVVQKKGQDKDLNELVEDEKKIYDNLKSNYSEIGKILKREQESFEDWIRNEMREPKFPYKAPHEYQTKAYKNWKENNYNGLFAMATGTGKTVTALNCILQEYQKNNFYRFIIIVPTRPLADQWQNEVSDKFNYQNVLNSCADTQWDKRLKRYLSSLKIGNEVNFCFITTYAQLKRKKMKNIIFQFQKEIESITFIADEAHALGSPGGIKNLPTPFTKRIGLTATPERKYDPAGSKAITDFFDSYPPNYTYYYSMKKAIEDGSLSEFEYNPIFVSLNEGELNEYIKYTEMLRPFLDTKNGGYKDTPKSKRLLIQRKHVIHKAQNKLAAISDIVGKIGSKNFEYAFVYVPEGYEPDYWQEEESKIYEEDEHIINNYSKLLDSLGLTVHNFLGGTKNRDRILKLFEGGKYDVLCAMKCLDEGVDVPRTEYAVFCASTGNPRQFIQRRGRVLRTCKGKDYAKIYDLVVAPNFERFGVIDDVQRDAEKKIFRNELSRIINFLALSSNCFELVEGEFGKKCEEFGIYNLKELVTEEIQSYKM